LMDGKRRPVPEGAPEHGRRRLQVGAHALAVRVRRPRWGRGFRGPTPPSAGSLLVFRQPQPQRRRSPLNAAAAVLAGIMLALIGPVGSALADDTDPAVTWSVQPADDTGVDGRAW